MGEPARPLGDPESNPFDVGLPMVAGIAPTPAEPPPPDIDPDDVEDTPVGEWDDWIAASAEKPASTVGITPGPGWDIPDYDRDDDYDDIEGARAAPALIDRTGRKAGSPLTRRARQRRTRDIDREEIDTTRRTAGALISVLVGLGLAVVLAALVINFVITPGKKTTPAASHAAKPTPVMDLAATPSTPPTTPTTTTTAPLPAAALAAATPGCEQRISTTEVSGTGPGNATTPGGVILAFEYAYYVERSGAKAASHVAPGTAGLGADGSRQPLTPDALQRSIDTGVPRGARYCVHATNTGGNVWDLDLSEQFPDDPEPLVWHQILTITTTSDGPLISAITSG